MEQTLDLTTMELDELRLLAYDFRVKISNFELQLEQLNSNLNTVEGEINRRIVDAQRAESENNRAEVVAKDKAQREKAEDTKTEE